MQCIMHHFHLKRRSLADRIKFGIKPLQVFEIPRHTKSTLQTTSKNTALSRWLLILSNHVFPAWLTKRRRYEHVATRTNVGLTILSR